MAPATYGAAFAAAMGVGVSLDGEGIVTAGGRGDAPESATQTAKQRRTRVDTAPVSALKRGSAADVTNGSAGDEGRGPKRGDHPSASDGDDTPYGGWEKWQQQQNKQARKIDQATVSHHRM